MVGCSRLLVLSHRRKCEESRLSRSVRGRNSVRGGEMISIGLDCTKFKFDSEMNKPHLVKQK